VAIGAVSVFQDQEGNPVHQVVVPAGLGRWPLVPHLLLCVDLGMLRIVLGPDKRNIPKHMPHHASLRFPADRLGALLENHSPYGGASFFAVAVAACVVVLELKPLAPREMTSPAVPSQCKLPTSHGVSVCFLICC